VQLGSAHMPCINVVQHYCCLHGIVDESTASRPLIDVFKMYMSLASRVQGRLIQYMVRTPIAKRAARIEVSLAAREVPW